MTGKKNNIPDTTSKFYHPLQYRFRSYTRHLIRRIMKGLVRGFLLVKKFCPFGSQYFP